jgi:protease IV
MKKYCTIIITISALLLITACSAPRVNLFGNLQEPLKEFTLEGSGADKILLIPINGVISDSPKKSLITSSPSIVEQVVSQLNKAEKKGDIRAVLFKIDSPGGSITASDMLYHEIMLFKERTKAKIIVSMTDIAASGAYYISLPADIIIAHPTTITGSIGVVFLQPKVTGLMDKIGLGVDVKKFGRYKDMGSPFRNSTEEEQKLMQKAVDDFGERFLNLAQKHRRLEKQSLDEVSTARVFLADEALKLGLIDKIGYLSDAVRETKKIAHLSENARVVIYRREEAPDINYYNTAAASTKALNISVINLELPEIMNFKAGFYYLWTGSITNVE